MITDRPAKEVFGSSSAIFALDRYFRRTTRRRTAGRIKSATVRGRRIVAVGVGRSIIIDITLVFLQLPKLLFFFFFSYNIYRQRTINSRRVNRIFYFFFFFTDTPCPAVNFRAVILLSFRDNDSFGRCRYGNNYSTIYKLS